jgi:glycosyltransferase involved in cell wall biosynthesis
MPKPPTPRRRILLTLPDLALGGGQRIVLNYLVHRDTAAFDVRLLTLRPEPVELADEFAATGVPVLCLDARPGARLDTSRRLASLLRRERIELVHPHGPDDRDLVLAPGVAARVPVLMHLHSEWNHRGSRLPPDPSRSRVALGRVKGFLRDRVEDWAVREYLADSPPVADAFATRVRRPVHAMTQSMPFTELHAARAAHDDRSWRSELGLGPGPVAITVSRLAEGKGQDRIIRAMAVVRRQVPNAQLLVVGDGDLRPACEALVADLGLGDAVRFLGTRRDVPRLLVGADVFAFASATESFGLVVAEAMAAGLAVVALRLPSLAGFTSAATGLFSDQDDDEGFARHLTVALGDRELARRLGSAGHGVVAHKFPAHATADSFEAAYRRVLGMATTPRDPAAEPAAADGIGDGRTGRGHAGRGGPTGRGQPAGAGDGAEAPGAGDASEPACDSPAVAPVHPLAAGAPTREGKR